MIRLQKFLAEAGVASRRRAEEIILEGRVTVNGEIMKELGTKIDPEKDKVLIDKKSITVDEKVYYLLNKPAGYTTTVKDKHAKQTVMELIPEASRIFPVGRLDKGTKGLLILTNDGELTFKLTHPKYEKEKEYILSIAKKLDDSDIIKLEKGMKLDQKMTMPVKLKYLRIDNDKFVYSIILKEGRNRQIRRMFEGIGHPVIDLQRIRIDRLGLGDLKEGDWRKIEDFEVDQLYNRRHKENQ